MSSIRNLKDRYRDDHPGFENYLDCMVRSRFSGLSAFALGLFTKWNIKYFHFVSFTSMLSSFSLGFASIYFSQKLVHKRFPLKIQTTVLLSLGFGTLVAYKISSDRSYGCQKAWLAAEDKYTALNQLDDEVESTARE